MRNVQKPNKDDFKLKIKLSLELDNKIEVTHNLLVNEKVLDFPNERRTTIPHYVNKLVIPLLKEFFEAYDRYKKAN